MTVTGDCRKVDVSGTSNTVSIEAVAAIEVTGTNDRVTWQRSLRGDAPRVSRTGLGSAKPHQQSGSQASLPLIAQARGAHAPVAARRRAPPDRLGQPGRPLVEVRVVEVNQRLNDDIGERAGLRQLTART
jgi:hypothetical protein